MKPGHLRHDVVGAGAAAAEDLHVQAGRLHPVERLDGAFVACERLIVPRLVALDVLGAAVVGQHAAQLQVRQLVHHLRELRWPDRPPARRCACRPRRRSTTSAVTPAALAASDRSLRVLREVDGLDEVAVLLAQAHRALNLRLAQIRRRHADLLHTVVEQRFRFAQLGRADADRARGQLQLRDVGRLVRLRVRPEPDLRRREAGPHLRDVLLELVEIEHEGRRVEIPFRHAAGGFEIDDMGHAVAMHFLGNPEARGARAGGRRQKIAAGGLRHIPSQS